MKLKAVCALTIPVPEKSWTNYS